MSISNQFDGAKLARRGIFFALLIGITLLYTTFSFRGLSHKDGIDQAQIGREVARGNGLSTKMVRPISIQQLESSDKKVNLNHMFDTYHAPLNVLVYAGVIKMVGGDDAGNYRMLANDTVYKLDRVIAVTCSLFFIISIGINYLLISRIFDKKIGSVVAILMMVSEYMWQITQSGLPQMLMLMLFSSALYMAWRAIEIQESKGRAFLPVIISGFFFALLVLTHWITLWMFVGYVIFACIYFRPRGVVAVTLIGIMLLFIVAPLIYYTTHSDNPLGTAFYALHAGGSRDHFMRSLEIPPLNIKGLNLRILGSFVTQVSYINFFLGGLVIAPAFFLALFHPFKRSSISKFRWGILLMWVFAAFGMSLYGAGDEAVDPNQVHMLFMPLMAAYAVAFLCIIWARVPLSQQGGLVGNLHIAVVVLITAGPLISTLFLLSRTHDNTNSPIGVNPVSLNRNLADVTDENTLIVSDQPWAIAWYADRQSIWMPLNSEQLEMLETIAEEQQTPVSGLHFTMASYQDGDILDSFRVNQDLSPIAYSPWMAYMSQSKSRDLFASNPTVSKLISPINGTYKHTIILENLFRPSIYYSRNAVTPNMEE
ncbi:hypothetical protein Rhal01_00256 [Rubritalea halochordaticola]|uniref:Glycosyltransferase RgtA/B/C/D-like domain-containing protein n=1 Tax=Rubritalea halochordaticola TaxID=714537 RepID=A0ABP9UUF2_9BACT